MTTSAEQLRGLFNRLRLTAAEVAPIVGRDKRNVNRWLQVGPPVDFIPLLLLVEEVSERSQATGPLSTLERLYRKARP